MQIYDCDHAATTAVDVRVLEAMMPYFHDNYGNPSALYGLSDVTRDAIMKARLQVADCIGAKPEEIFFTAGGSESDNWAWKGVYYKTSMKSPHFITSQTEHHAVLNTAIFLEEQGASVTYLPVDEQGHISLSKLEDSINDNTVLVSIMAANNEIGTIAPVGVIGKICKKKKILFHTDAVQAFGQVPLNVSTMNIDMLSASAHKLGGPKGCGFLYVRKGVELCNLIHGGGQEQGLRAGTENVAGIVGLGEAARLANESMELRRRKCVQLREYMIGQIMRQIPYTRINGDRFNRLPGNISVTIQFVNGSAILGLLDNEKIYASAGSACNASSKSVSHVLKAIHLPEELAMGTLRFTISDQLSKKDIDYIVAKLKQAVEYVRAESEDYQNMISKSYR